MTSFTTHQGCRAKREACSATEAGSRSGVNAAIANDIRRGFFAAGLSVSRFGVDADDLIAHAGTAADFYSAAPLDPARLHLEDLALAAAVCKGNAGAWQELVARHERIMLHSSQAHLAGADALCAVRQLLSRVREETLHGGNGPLSLRRYPGITPLRAWLLDRLVVMIYRQQPLSNQDVRVERGLSTVGRLRLGARFVRVDGMPVQQAARIVGLRERDVRRAAASRAGSRTAVTGLPEPAALEPAESGTGPAT
jgi:hypothetical protein